MNEEEFEIWFAKNYWWARTDHQDYILFKEEIKELYLKEK